jgi:hypothetical protein
VAAIVVVGIIIYVIVEYATTIGGTVYENIDGLLVSTHTITSAVIAIIAMVIISQILPGWK